MSSVAYTHPRRGRDVVVGSTECPHCGALLCAWPSKYSADPFFRCESCGCQWAWTGRLARWGKDCTVRPK